MEILIARKGESVHYYSVLPHRPALPPPPAHLADYFQILTVTSFLFPPVSLRFSTVSASLGSNEWRLNARRLIAESPLLIGRAISRRFGGKIKYAGSNSKYKGSECCRIAIPQALPKGCPVKSSSDCSFPVFALLAVRVENRSSRLSILNCPRTYIPYDFSLFCEDKGEKWEISSWMFV